MTSFSGMQLQTDIVHQWARHAAICIAKAKRSATESPRATSADPSLLVWKSLPTLLVCRRNSGYYNGNSWQFTLKRRKGLPTTFIFSFYKIYCWPEIPILYLYRVSAKTPQTISDWSRIKFPREWLLIFYSTHSSSWVAAIGFSLSHGQTGIPSHVMGRNNVQRSYMKGKSISLLYTYPINITKKRNLYLLNSHSIVFQEELREFKIFFRYIPRATKPFKETIQRMYVMVKKLICIVGVNVFK